MPRAIVFPALLFVVLACSGGATAYTLRVAFNDAYTQSGGDEVTLAIQAYDSDATLRLQESFPPTLVATVHTAGSDFCDRIRAQLEPRPDVANVDCTSE